MKSAVVKKMLAGSLALALSLSLSGISALTPVVQAQAAQSKAEKALISKAEELAEKDEDNLGPSYGLFDITGDEVPELFYARHYVRVGISVFYYDDAAGKVKPMKTVDGQKSLGGVADIRAAASGNKFIVSMSDSAYSGEVSTFKATKKNKLKAVTKYEYNYDSEVFTKNGKKITKKAFEKYQKKIGKLESIDFGTSLNGETSASETQEVSADAAVASENMYVGTWAEKTSGRVVITVDPAIGDEGFHDVQITWREDLPQKDVYDMRAKYQEDGSMYYDNCRHVVRTFKEDGTYEDEVKYEHGSGLLNIDLDEKVLYWTDYEQDKQSESRVQTFIKEMSSFKSEDGWTVKYDSLTLNANTEEGGASFVYTGESAGSNMATIRYVANKKPEDVLKELTKDWSAEDAKMVEAAFPGKEGQTAYRCMLGVSDTSVSNLQETLIAGSYKDGTLLFDLTTHNSGKETIDIPVSDALSEVINSITYENAK